MRLHLRELRAGSGIPIVLLHGWLGCGADFEAFADAPQFDGRTVLAFDLVGHGESPDPDREYDFADVARWVVEALPSPTVDLVGYSMGGRVALYVAGMHRERIRRLALIGAHPGIDHPQHQRDRLELDAERATSLIADPASFLEQWQTLELFGPATSAPWAAVRARRVEASAATVFGWSRALLCLSTGRQLSLWNVPYGVALPTLFAVGAHDEKYLDVAREFAALNPAVVSIGLIVGAHHAAHLDRPLDLARRVCQFLDD